MGVLEDTKGAGKAPHLGGQQADIRTRVDGRIAPPGQQAGYRIVLRCTIGLTPARILAPD
ncbi:hypothetical protein X805_18850 [Sphaerotilus natans subsp. natans DSM 6575]|uniref:Uncharacterized protein n=1 Tax=Sphaerotilus natans subsp. natans DSM 6575 TaxID=1286631 RepID=A0A059KN96_9BURK|nr:hypothetical protein [Sphaerotilus natans]KDB52543.1 hypothetical protein X805_18850 [Sphaerotilus natans subsp. natans DSM 6575]